MERVRIRLLLNMDLVAQKPNGLPRLKVLSVKLGRRAPRAYKARRESEARRALTAQQVHKDQRATRETQARLYSRVQLIITTKSHITRCPMDKLRIMLLKQPMQMDEWCNLMLPIMQEIGTQFLHFHELVKWMDFNSSTMNRPRVTGRKDSNLLKCWMTARQRIVTSKFLLVKPFQNMSEPKQKLWQESSISIRATIALYSRSLVTHIADTILTWKTLLQLLRVSFSIRSASALRMTSLFTVAISLLEHGIPQSQIVLSIQRITPSS